MASGSEGDNPIEFADEVGKAKDDSKGGDGSNKSIDEDVLEIFTKIFLLEIISSCKDHRGKQGIEEYFLIEVHPLNLPSNVERTSE